MTTNKKTTSKKTKFRYPYMVDLKSKYMKTITSAFTKTTITEFDWHTYEYDEYTMSGWCHDHCKNDFSENEARWWFENKQDAMLFKIVWG